MLEIKTEKPVQVIDITRQVNDAVKESGVVEGLCLVYTLHTTTGIVINEAESGLVQDLGNSQVIPIEEGCLVMGTWQRVLFLELDGPRRRNVYLKIVPG
jgi:thiamine phosphate synthase YjbQ (UPF0047 family)